MDAGNYLRERREKGGRNKCREDKHREIEI
jgi:hypothetical protein